MLIKIQFQIEIRLEIQISNFRFIERNEQSTVQLIKSNLMIAEATQRRQLNEKKIYRISQWQWHWQPPQLISFITFVSRSKNVDFEKVCMDLVKELPRRSSFRAHNSSTRNQLQSMRCLHTCTNHTKYIKMGEPTGRAM